MKKIKAFMAGMGFRMIAGTTFCLLFFNLITSIIGYAAFTNSFTAEYTDSTYHIAQTAASLVDGDRIDEYLTLGWDAEGYQDRYDRMNKLCQLMDVTFIYAIAVDTSDYNHFRSVFNTVAQDSGYTPWEPAHLRETTNDEYRSIYRDIYENGLEQGTITRTSNLNGGTAHITSLVPIRDSQGTVTAILCVQRDMDDLVTGRASYFRGISFSTFGMILLSAVVLAYFLRHQFVIPTQKIISEAKRFAKENTKQEPETFQKISRVWEIQELAASVEKLEEDVIRYTEDLTAVTAEKERIGAELSIATQIQASMLPCIFPPFPERKEFDLYASMAPAKEVGGDFYDFFLVDDNHLALVIADVSGKGVPAALFMVIAKTLLKNSAQSGASPKEILEKVNGQLCENNEAEMFVTVWLGILEISTGKLTCANAGHEYPALCRKGGRYELVRDKHGFVLAGLETARYQEYVLELHSGDTLYVYTDGIPEATDGQEQMFGTDRMLAALDQTSGVPLKQMLPQLRQSIDQFVGDAPQFDDITMLAMRYNGPEEPR